MSITTVPITEAVDQPGLLDKITTYIASAKVAAADGLTWSEFGELLLALLEPVPQPHLDHKQLPHWARPDH
jgi:hypothetical protein